MRNPILRGATHSAALLLVILLGLVAPAAVLAEEAGDADHGGVEAEHKASHFHRNHFRGLVAWSHKDSGKTSATFGMEYTRFLSRHIGIAVFMEQSEGDFSADSTGLLLVGKPTKHLNLFAGPGIERTLFNEREHEFRAGLSYTFSTKGVDLTPVATVDFVAGHKIYSVGIAVGKGF
jgi:hypothetical protein